MISDIENQPLNKGLFGDDFKWGVSTAAAQTEGALDADGRGRFAFCREETALVQRLPERQWHNFRRSSVTHGPCIDRPFRAIGLFDEYGRGVWRPSIDHKSTRFGNVDVVIAQQFELIEH